MIKIASSGCEFSGRSAMTGSRITANLLPVRWFAMSIVPLFLAADPLLPIRIMAVIALVAVIAVFVYVLRHLGKIERAITADNIVPTNRGPRNNMVLIVCAIPIVLVGLLLFLIIKA